MLEGVKGFFAELSHRRVYHVAVAYIVVGLGVLGAAELILDPLGLDAIRPFVVVLTVLGFPLALVLAWAYEIRPESGLQAQPSHRHDDRLKLAGEIDPSAGRKSIVVLPFDNMSPDASDTYFSDGLTDEIITDLSQVSSLRVISRNSAMALKGTHKNIAAIGRELNVQYVLEGSVRRAGENLRITAQLIDARSDEHLWAERYDGTLDDVFGIQEEVSQAIVGALDLRINPRERKKLLERPISDKQAYECYLRAKNDLYRGTAESLNNALRHLESALKIHGEDVLIYQGIAEVYIQSYEYGVKPDGEVVSKAEEYTQRVLTLRPDSASGHYLRGRIERFKGSASSAVRHFEMALKIDPDHVGALGFWIVASALQIGRPNAAEAAARHLLAIDPFNPLALLQAGLQQWFSGREEEALSTFDRAVQLEPDFLWATLHGTAFVLAWQDRTEEALEVVDPITRREPQDHYTSYAGLIRSALLGDRRGAEAALASETADFFWRDADAPWFVAALYARAGCVEHSLKWLQRAVDRGWINYPLFSRQDPLLGRTREEPRFKELVQRIKSPWERTEVAALAFDGIGAVSA